MKRLDQQKMAPWLFISPFFVLFAVFSIFPVGFNIFLSFHKWGGGVRPMKFIGFDNYTYLLNPNGDPYFWKTVGITGWLLIFGSLTQHLIAVPVAILLNNKMLKGRNFFKTAYFLPYITSTVSVSLVFQILYAYQSGWFNFAIGMFGGDKVDWLQSRHYLPISVAILINWKYVGWNTVIYLAGLQSIPNELYESADIDGAPTVTKHVHITIPLLMPIIFFAVTVSIIGGMNLFVEPFILTRGYENMGGGGNSVFTVAFYIMWLLQRAGRLGRGAAVSWILFIIVVIMTLVNRFLTNLVEGNTKPTKKKRKTFVKSHA